MYIVYSESIRTNGVQLFISHHSTFNIVFIQHSSLSIVQCFYGSYAGGFAGWNEAGKRTGDNHDHQGLYAHVKAYSRVEEHGGFEKSGIYLLVPDGSIHIFVGGNAAEHADVAEECGDDNATANRVAYDMKSCLADFKARVKVK